MGIVERAQILWLRRIRGPNLTSLYCEVSLTQSTTGDKSLIYSRQRYRGSGANWRVLHGGISSVMRGLTLAGR